MCIFWLGWFPSDSHSALFAPQYPPKLPALFTQIESGARFSALELAQYVSFQNILGWRPQRHAGSKCSYRLISVISVGARPASGFSICWLQFDGRTCHIAKASGFSNHSCDEVLGCAGKCPHRKETHHNMLLNLIALWVVPPPPGTHSKSAWWIFMLYYSLTLYYSLAFMWGSLNVWSPSGWNQMPGAKNFSASWPLPSDSQKQQFAVLHYISTEDGGWSEKWCRKMKTTPPPKNS